MKTTSSQKIKIGAFTVVGLLVLFLAVFYIGNQKSLFSSTFKVYGTFKNVSGLTVGNNVRFAGINVGVVEAINIVTDSSVRVDLTLNNSVRKFIKTDSKMSIGSDGLMGDKLVVIAPGGITSQTEISEGKELGSVNPVDVDKIITKLIKVADNAESLTSDLSQIVAKVNSGKGSIGRLLNNDKIARDLEGTVKQAQTTMKGVHSTTATLNEDLKAAQHNFLLRGFFKKKEKAAKAKQDSIKKVQEEAIKAKEKAAKDVAKKKNDN
ncbi:MULTISPECIES: MlaD family protein [unclassified Mucilaginibacter]|uniref:MlaD family protein n=1 Tax=unclassified Mucilaginibacter TaxID=2617802 RepID=UPI002AC8EF69|nr:MULTISPECIES: MlaD family protein [unclassified Mucilaginibacter]MEB0261673.1 MlaD family protein [Mucilaginibacter sp. 10I4]MEB0278323.1 MlaD family protein [Mucilaginibacter sp. 10B2]MEB0301178.1 MlaD family protein [Mucilaginibacter sp. 5C4]WPX23969.1 MlaD family protein [Mucilaginibacter sp. 5C4]